MIHWKDLRSHIGRKTRRTTEHCTWYDPSRPTVQSPHKRGQGRSWNCQTASIADALIGRSLLLVFFLIFAIQLFVSIIQFDGTPLNPGHFDLIRDIKRGR